MSTSILKVLTELTALTPNGIVTLKAFRPMFGEPLWRHRHVGMRVLNAGEIEGMMAFLGDFPVTAQDQAMKKEIVARSLWFVDGKYVANKEDLDKYNEENKTHLSELEYKRVFVNSFEQYLVEYLYTVYEELQKKQTRKIFNLGMCAVCKSIVSGVPEGARKIRFDVAEYICEDCFTKVVEDDGFEFEDKSVPAAPKVEPSVPEASATPDVPKAPAVKTPADFATIEEYRNYLIEMADTHGAQAT